MSSGTAGNFHPSGTSGITPVPGWRFDVACKWPLATLLFFALSGCTTLVEPPEPVADPDAAFALREAALAGVVEWTASGKLAVSVPEESVSATLRWHQLREEYSIRLSGPLGQGQVHIDGRPGWVSMRTSQGTFLARRPEELLQAQVGWSVPVVGLRYWILGRAQPDMPVTVTLDAAGRPSELVQGEWRVSYQGYRRFQGLELPVRLEVENPRISARLVVKRWELEGKGV